MKQKTLADNLQDLPKWAQSEIKVIQIGLSESKKELDRLRENPKSNTILGTPFLFADEKIQYLKNDQTISFMLEKGHLQVRVERGYVNIHASGEGDLFVKPIVSNGIQLHLK